ncbi:hypothetical protein D6D04_04626 [Aureobasidium pullulans]|nr:hypothetical protein D6D04_04626 [Aureobasidium pullulans]
MDMVEGAAPNLQEVSMHLEAGYGGPPLGPPVLHPKRERNSGIVALSSTKATVGALRSLEIMEQESGRALRFWKSKTDFGVLQSLKVHYYLLTPDFYWLAKNCQFSSLNTLVIHLGTDGEEDDCINSLQDAVESFISSLPPLRSVKLTGQYTHRIVDTMINHCGRKLRHLLLGSPFDLKHAVFASVTLSRAIQEKCPFIEELALPFMRSRGSADETAIYQSFAQMPTICKLRLSIFCSQPFLWDEDQQMLGGELDYQVALGERPDLADQVAHTIVDLAIDKTLATSIFHTIVSARGSTPLALDTLGAHGLALATFEVVDPTSVMLWNTIMGKSFADVVSTTQGCKMKS